MRRVGALAIADHRLRNGAVNRARVDGARAARAGRGLFIRSAGVLLAVAALAALSACALGGGATTGRSSSTTAPTPIASCPPAASASASDRLTRAACVAVIGLAGRVETTYDPQSQTVQTVVTFVGTRVPRTNQQMSAAQEAVKTVCFRVQRALWTSGFSLTQVTVMVDGPILDDFFDLITDWYGGSRLTSRTAAALEWRSVSADDAWAGYNQVWLRTAYVPNQYYSASPASTPLVGQP